MRYLRKIPRLREPGPSSVMARLLSVFVFVLASTASSAQAGEDQMLPDAVAQIDSHHLTVDVTPTHHQLRVLDRLVVRIHRSGRARLAFLLHKALMPKRVNLDHDGIETDVRLTYGPEGTKEAEQGARLIIVEWAGTLSQNDSVVLVWEYGGLIDDPPREPRHLRFVTPSETAGHIGPEGVYLSGETHWYPDLADSLPVFDIEVSLPQGWQAVTHGRRVGESMSNGKWSSTWTVTAKTEALTLVANRFVRSTRPWRDIDVETYLFEEDQALAPEYLDASTRYLETYTERLGPYPYPKFAVVENFFASGLGMPSLTLLGSGVIKRHYVQPYALGHEIVHSWIGNWVFNQPESGNWVEGLTTYLANYYYDELTGTPAEAREQRRLMIAGYAVYVPPDRDYAIGEFTRKTDQKDNAIGYQKAAMVFHMLRREIGEDAFWSGLRTLVQRYAQHYAAWADIAEIFSASAGRDLGWFFAQWVDQPGAPEITSFSAAAIPADRESSYRVTVKVEQSRPAYRLLIPLHLELDDGTRVVRSVSVNSRTQTLEVLVPRRPRTVAFDPDLEVFRRIPRHALPPMLNLFVTDDHRSVLVAGSADQKGPYSEVVGRLRTQAGGIDVVTAADRLPPRGSVLILGGTSVGGTAETAWAACGDRVKRHADGIVIGERDFRGAQLAFLISCRRAGDRNAVVTFFDGTPAGVGKVARLLFFYGWASYVIFDEGKVIARGDFIEEDPLTVHLP